MIHVFFFSNLPEKNFRKISELGCPGYYEGPVDLRRKPILLPLGLRPEAEWLPDLKR
jgi:hypothetical protein